MNDYVSNNFVSDKVNSELAEIKKNVEHSAICFKQNAERFHEFTKFVYQTAISIQDESVLKSVGKPIIEFNITNAPIARLCGEFSKQVPSVTVKAEDGEPIDAKTIEVVEGHLRHIIYEANKLNTQYNIYKDQMVGGYSVSKTWTDYANEMSFDQVIKWSRVYEPTFCGFDPNARAIDKHDAEYCWERFPMPIDKFKKEYPRIDISEIRFNESGSESSWAYTNESDQENVIVICDYYKKKRKRFRIVKLSNNKVMRA